MRCRTLRVGHSSLAIHPFLVFVKSKSMCVNTAVWIEMGAEFYSANIFDVRRGDSFKSRLSRPGRWSFFGPLLGSRLGSTMGCARNCPGSLYGPSSATGSASQSQTVDFEGAIFDRIHHWIESFFSNASLYIHMYVYIHIYIWFNVIMVSSRYGVALWSSWFFGKCLGLKELAVHFGRPPKTRKASDGFCFSESLAQFRLTWCNGLDPPHFEPERWCLLYPSIFKNTTRILLLALDFIQGDHGARRSLWPVLSENSAFWRQGRGSDGWDGIGILD